MCVGTCRSKTSKEGFGISNKLIVRPDFVQGGL